MCNLDIKIPCPKCGNIFEPITIGGYTRKFCSRSCSSSRNFSEESKRKKSAAQKKWWKGLSDDERIKQIEKRLSKASDAATKSRQYKRDNTPTELLGYSSRRRKVFEDQNKKCLKCGLNDWLGEKITLELDHVDGNKHNNKRENLVMLCPNCHSQTPTWRGRNRNIVA